MIQISSGICYDSLLVVVVLIRQAFDVGLSVVVVTVVFEFEFVATVVFEFVGARRFPFRLSSGFSAFPRRRSRMMIFRPPRGTGESPSRIHFRRQTRPLERIPI